MEAKIEIRIWSDDEQPDTGDLPELFHPHVEHVAAMLLDGYTSGQVVDEKFTGWWEVITS